MVKAIARAVARGMHRTVTGHRLHRATVLVFLILLHWSILYPQAGVTGQALSLRDHAMCLDVDPVTERPLNRTYRIYTVWKQAVSWFEVEIGEIGPLQVSWYWQNPAGRVHRSTTRSVMQLLPGARRFWDVLPVRGDLENMTGSWAVSVYFRAQLLFNESFVVDSSAYEVTVSIKGLDPSLGTQVAVDGVNVGSMNGGAAKVYTLTTGASHNVSVQGAIMVGNATRYLCRPNWQIVSSRTQLPLEISFNYELQFYLLVKSERGEVEPNVNGWYRNGTIVTFKVSTIVWALAGTRYLFKSWKGGLTTDLPSASLVMNGPKTVEAVWVTDYMLLFIVILSIIGACVLVFIYALLKRREARRIRF
ncbi:MAG: hypothetical protein V1857_03170 [archaeon]